MSRSQVSATRQLQPGDCAALPAQFSRPSWSARRRSAASSGSSRWQRGRPHRVAARSRASSAQRSGSPWQMLARHRSIHSTCPPQGRSDAEGRAADSMPVEAMGCFAWWFCWRASPKARPQPPDLARLPGFFLCVAFPRSRPRFCPVGFVFGMPAGVVVVDLMCIMVLSGVGTATRGRDLWGGSRPEISEVGWPFPSRSAGCWA